MNSIPFRKTIISLSIGIPLAIALLFSVKVEGYDFRFLPGIYATINALTALLLSTAYVSIKLGKRAIHEWIMKTCVGLSASFLVLYVLYHITTPSTAFGGEGIIKYIYYFILISHILLSIVITPLVLLTLAFALGNNFERHRKLAKFTFPIWLYVAGSGVVVYILISPYYQ